MIATTRQYLGTCVLRRQRSHVFVPTSYAVPSSPRTAAAPGAISRRIGAVKAISGHSNHADPDSGPDVNVTVQPTTRVVRIAPGEKDLKNATPVQLQDVQVGDRILVGGKLSEDNLSLAASSVVVMKRSDLQARDQQNLQDWQKRGVMGCQCPWMQPLGTVTLSVRGRNTIIHTSSATVIRRYPPDSVKF